MRPVVTSGHALSRRISWSVVKVHRAMLLCRRGEMAYTSSSDYQREASFLQSIGYEPPAWATTLATDSPARRIVLGNFPTPIMPFSHPHLPKGVELFIKRDDFSGIELSGNKARKLEFLLQAALDAKADSVITCGGTQSNHCRATAVGARMLGMDSYLLLRDATPDADPGWTGNLLIDRLVGAHILLLSKHDYAKHGSTALLERAATLLKNGKNGPRRPFIIPVGGSNALGTWGYLEMVRELEEQIERTNHNFTDIAMACGSAGTSCGIALGVHLSKLPMKVHAYGVCDSPRYFYEYMSAEILPGLGAGHILAENIIRISDAKGAGYAMSVQKELQFIAETARSTGVVLDPVYSGKALMALLKQLREQPQSFKGKKILFVHTGGMLGIYERWPQLSQISSASQEWRRLPLS